MAVVVSVRVPMMIGHDLSRLDIPYSLSVDCSMATVGDAALPAGCHLVLLIHQQGGRLDAGGRGRTSGGDRGGWTVVVYINRMEQVDEERRKRKLWKCVFYASLMQYVRCDYVKIPC